eukprot:GGOE01024565.1.p1 GENE.GGOE01024565.1~~GGOE01024565.1.p1  ORF type:complete len:825 (+),score=202.77 GGOE01024565.1:93-2477(+)
MSQEPPPPTPTPHARQRQCSVSLMVVMLVPTVALMVAMALAAWVVVYGTAYRALEILANEGQACFVQATRRSLLSYTNSIQNVHTVNRLRWVNTTCNGTGPNPFDSCDDVRLALFSQAEVPSSLGQEGVTLTAAFPSGSALLYQSFPTNSRWDIYNGTALTVYHSDTWNASWRAGLAVQHPKSSNPSTFNVTTRDWFAAAVRAGRQAWMGVAYSSACSSLSLPAVMPVFHPDGALKLVAHVQPCLHNLDTQINGVRITPNIFAFVAQMDGTLLATVPEGLSLKSMQHGSMNESMLASVFTTKKPLSTTATWLQGRFGSFVRIPQEDSWYKATIDGEVHYIFTGHVADEFGLHWIVVIGIPARDLMGGIDNSTTNAIVTLVVMVGVTVAIIATATLAVRRSLQSFAKRISKLGSMNLEAAQVVHMRVYLSELTPIMESIQRTAESLLQFRTFLPQPMLDQINAGAKSAEDSKGELTTPVPPSCMEDSRLDVPTDSAPSSMAVTIPTPTRTRNRQTVAQTLERRMEYTMVTMLFLQLPNLHRLSDEGIAPTELMQWYDRCLSSALTIVQRCKGEFHKLLGDLLVFTWGAVRQVAGQEPRCCHAAVQLSSALRELDGQPTSRVKCNSHISIVSGMALCGVMGTATTRDLYIIGGLVGRGCKLAAMNSVCETSILVDQEVAKQCESMFQLVGCGFVAQQRPDRGGPEMVFEVVHPTDQDTPGDRETEWMYKLVPTDIDVVAVAYQEALDFLRRGNATAALEKLQMVRRIDPSHKHARRMLSLVEQRDVAGQGLAALVD